MVRIRSRPKPTLLEDVDRQPTRKRKSGEPTNNSTSGGISPRLSKRTRTTQFPYQSPESVHVLVAAASKSTRTANKNETTPKRNATAVKLAKTPKKVVTKRLQKSSTPKTPIIAKLPIRRKILKIPDLPKRKNAQKKNNAHSNRAKIAKTLKVGKIITKAKVPIKSPLVLDSGSKKRKLSLNKKLQQKDEILPLKKEKEMKVKGKLSPKPDLTRYDKDPMFETRLEIPFISTLSHSRLLIRAVILNDMKMLKKLINDEPEKIYSFSVPRCAVSDDTVFDYICKFENKEAFKILNKPAEKVLKKLGSSPTMMISAENTGRPSYMMFGHGMRQVSVGRGGKEGNNAFLYDYHNSYSCSQKLDCEGSMIKRATELGVSLGYIDFLRKEISENSWDYVEVRGTLRKGHHEIAGVIVSKANKQGGYGFNFLHEEALTKKKGEPLTPFKPVSVTKKCTYEPRFSPLHCAAINPNADVLVELLRAIPDYNLMDKDGWSIGHYASVCSGPEPLKHLLQFGITTQAVTSTKRGGDGFTLLHAAVSAGRAHNVKLILEHEKKSNKESKGNEDDGVDEKGKQKVLLQNDIKYKLTTKGKNALQMACELGHYEIVRLLLEAGTDPNKQTPAKLDSVTPLMLAAMHGYLDIVKLLIKSGVKVDAKDKRGRTVIHHAAMNGQSHILSYLLRLGVNPLALDSSGNSLLHYSAAYGWYFATLLSLDAGCPPNATNHWKMTPMAIAFMKGHTGLVTVLMQKEGVDVNARIDDASGRTLLLEACSAWWDAERLKFLVEELGADPKCEDFNGNNALHLLTNVSLPSNYRDDYEEKRKAFVDCLTYLINKDCNPFKKNLDEISPVLLSAQRNNFHFLSNLLDLNMQIPNENDKSGNTLLHYLSQDLTEAKFEVFTKLCSMDENISALNKMALTHNQNGCTPLLTLLKGCNYESDEQKSQIQLMVNTYFDKLGANANAKIEGNGNSQKTPLHLTVGTYILPTILKQKPSLDSIDDKGHTPLVTAVLNGHQHAAETLINAGADVNFKFKEEWKINLLLYTTMKETKSFYLIPKLIAKGANPRQIHPKTLNSALHYIARRPTLQYAVEALSAILQAGVNPNLVNNNGRTALHVAVNARGSETDVFYDIEDALISAGANLSIKDERGRIPLHYCFVKRAAPTDSGFFDPIELVSHIVTAMKSAGAHAEIHSADAFGSTPLHYAAFRGATICSSFLMQPLPREGIDMRDKNGNTPFGLAVRNQHEGCALNFFQKDADYLRTINNDIRIQEMKIEQALETQQTRVKNEVWEWEHIKDMNEEAKKLKEDNEVYPILEQVVKNDWQGMLYLMIGQLQETGKGFSIGIITALKLQRLKLALKVALKVKQKKELTLSSGTLFHTLAKCHNGADLEINKSIYEVFKKLGLNPVAVDEFGAQPVIYAMVNQQIKFCDVLFGNMNDDTTIKMLATMKPDLFGRTPFTGLFWNAMSKDFLEKDLQTYAMKLLAKGADPNQQCEYPLKLSSLPGVRFTKKLIDITPSDAPRYPPLILAVIINKHLIVKWLLTMKKNSVQQQVNINAQDSKGRTAIMHAVRLNDVKMVKVLLDAHNYNYEKDEDGLKPIKLKSTNVDLRIRDKHGWTVIDYLMFSPRSEYYHKNVRQILQLLQQVGAATNITSGDGLNILDKAHKHKRHDLLEILSKLTSIPQSKKSLLVPEQYFNFTSRFSQDITLMPVDDYKSAAEKMAEKQLEKAREKLRKEGKDEFEKPTPDPLCGLEKDNAELVLDEQQNIPYDCLMTKVDINYGIHGLYNFYKMQLIKQPRGKEMIILFTEWGRVGLQGQHQKTPFTTIEEGVKEFTKIFKQKSGNAWEDVKNFTPILTKYRLVPRDLRLVKYSTQTVVNFDELEKAGKNIQSVLPSSILSLMKNLCFNHKDIISTYNKNRKFGIRRWRNDSDPDYSSLPLLPTDELVKAEGILKEIEEKLTKLKEMQQKSEDFTEKDKIEVMEEIVKSSETFYQLIPIYGFASQNLQPLLQEDDIRQKLIAISRVIHLETAKSLLLAAQYNKVITNPFEYVFRCLGTKIELLDRSITGDHEEMELILQYIHNTGSDVKVHGIYRVEVPMENELLNSTNVHNRQLLWHGTSSVNLLSILQQGLQIAPLSANISGHLFGKGIYLADIFEKSQHYCGNIPVNGQNRKFMLLCEAALGKIFEVELEKACEKPMPKDYNSLKTADSKYEPNPESTIVWKGRTVALGEKTEKFYKENEEDGWHYRLDYNEYIVFNSDQVALRYLIEFED